MRTLVIECATDACSVALLADSEVVAATSEVIGRGHAERLIPMIAQLPDKGRADRIAVSRGPGSFTGVRIGIAAARALALAWGAETVGYPTLALVAAMARAREPGSVTVCMTGGHGQWFVQDFAGSGLPDSELASLTPSEAAARMRHRVVAGSQASALAETGAFDTLPDARAFPHLPASLISAEVSPIYGRAPDARLPT